MNHLLIDLESVSVKLKRIPEKIGSIILFSKRKKTFKQAVDFAQHHASVEVVDLMKNDANSMLLEELKTRLQQNHHAKITVIAKRKKLKKAIKALCAVYPHADVQLFNRLSKKQRAFLEKQRKAAKKQGHDSELLPEVETLHDEAFLLSETDVNTPAVQSESLPDNSNVNDVQDNQDVAEEVQETGDTIIASENEAAETAQQEPVVESVGAQVVENVEEKASNQNIQQAAQLMKKTRPKKKNDLMKTLQTALHWEEAEVSAVLEQLQAEGWINIDVAENVKYSV